MKVTLDKDKGIVYVLRESNDPYFKHSGWSDAESTFLYHVKQELIKQGYDCIKKRMWKDGHLVDDTRQYIRDRKGKWYIYNPCWAVRDAGDEFNKYGTYELWYEEWE